MRTIQQQIEDILLEATDGNIPSLKAYIILQDIEKLCKDAKEGIKEDAYKEASRYGAKTFDEYGRTITLSEGRRTWKYDHIKEWNDKKAELSTVEEKAKSFAQMYEKNPGKPIFDENGAEVDIAISTFSKPIITIK